MQPRGRVVAARARGTTVTSGKSASAVRRSSSGMAGRPSMRSRPRSAGCALPWPTVRSRLVARVARISRAALRSTRSPSDGEVSSVQPSNGERTEGAFAGKAAIVTGGGSGIGAAISRALATRGAAVVIADIDEPAAKAVAGAIVAAGGQASIAVLDVRDAVAVADLVSQTTTECGELDLMFNNAGIAVGGLVEEFTLEHWDRVLDVNVRGVVHGVHAAYPVMLRQGHGHIVNTASLAGLVPGPGLAPYTAAKHAVVGLSLSLRAEGASRGVKVSAVCPGFVDTPIFGRVNPDLPQTEAGANAAALARQLGKFYQADALAQDVLRGVERNKALIVAPRSARIAWRMARYAPGVTMRSIISGVRRRAAQAAAEPVQQAQPAETARPN